MKSCLLGVSVFLVGFPLVAGWKELARHTGNAEGDPLEGGEDQ